MNYDEYLKIVKECEELSRKKNADYGDDCLKRFGILGINVRLYDKIERLTNLIYNNKKQSVNDESIEDTLKDIINYSIYCIIINRGEL